MQKIISILLSLLMLASSSGVAYAKHYCGDYEMLSEITLGEKDLSCGMVMEIPACDQEEEDEHTCCDNQYTKVDTDDTFNKSTFDVNLNQDFVLAFVSVFVLRSVDNFPSENHFFIAYSPPPLDRDMQVLYESFLI